MTEFKPARKFLMLSFCPSPFVTHHMLPLDADMVGQDEMGWGIVREIGEQCSQPWAKKGAAVFFLAGQGVCIRVDGIDSRLLVDENQVMAWIENPGVQPLDPNSTRKKVVLTAKRELVAPNGMPLK